MQRVGVPEKYLKMVGSFQNDTQGILRLYYEMGGLIIKWAGGAMIFIFLLLPEMVYNTFGTDVFSIRKNVRKWIESQMECFIPMFCFKVNIYNLNDSLCY